MKRAAVIEQLKQTQDNLAKLLALSKPARQTSLPRTFINPADNTAAPANKGNKAVEQTVLSTYQVAQSLGFNGHFRAWEHLLRIHE
jgi:hypothetical protein